MILNFKKIGKKLTISKVWFSRKSVSSENFRQIEEFPIWRLTKSRYDCSKKIFTCFSIVVMFVDTTFRWWIFTFEVEGLNIYVISLWPVNQSRIQEAVGKNYLNEKGNKSQTKWSHVCSSQKHFDNWRNLSKKDFNWAAAVWRQLKDRPDWLMALN